MKSMKLIKCQVCDKNVKTNADSYIIHCSIRQPINNQNWLNRPQHIEIKEPETPEADQENKLKVPLKTKGEHEEEAEGIPSEESHIKPASSNASNSPNKAPEELKSDEGRKEPKDLELSAENEEDIEKTHPHRCSCGTRFTDKGILDNSSNEGVFTCPNCETQFEV